MAETVVYRDKNYPTTWIENGVTIADYLEKKGFVKKSARELRTWLEYKIKEESTSESVVVFSQDMIPDTILSSLNSPNDLIRKYLDIGGRAVWIGHTPFWDKGKRKDKEGKDREEIWKHDTPYAMLGVQPLIAVGHFPCEWEKGWDKRMKSTWYSHRPVNVEVADLKIEPLALAEVTLLPCPWNMLVITRWKKAGRKVASFGGSVGISPFTIGGNIPFTEDFPEELSLEHQRLACAWHVSFNKEYPKQGFYRFWDRGISKEEEPPEELLEDIYTLATLDL